MFNKIKFYKRLLIEILETLCSICICLDRECQMSRYHRDGFFMRSHVRSLKEFSEELRKEVKNDS